MNFLVNAIQCELHPERMAGSFIGESISEAEYHNFPEDWVEGFKIAQSTKFTLLQYSEFGEAALCLSLHIRKHADRILPLFYDHFLSRSWDTYVSVPLAQFREVYYQALKAHRAYMPLKYKKIAGKLISQDWLTSIQRMDGVQQVMMSNMGRGNYKTSFFDAINDVQQNYSYLRQCFTQTMDLVIPAKNSIPLIA